MENPKFLKPVLAYIRHLNDLGLSRWYEVVYFDVDITKQWKSYHGSITFNDGEQVIAWKYTEECL